MSDIALAGVAATEQFVLVADRELDDSVDVFRCLDARTGKEQWAVRYPAPGHLDYGNSSRATPLINGDRAFLFGAHGHLRCVELATGRLVWQRNVIKEFGVTAKMPWGLCGSPLLVDGKLVLNPGGADASIVALDPATGKTLWKTPGEPASYGSLIAGTLGGTLQIVGHDKTTLGGWEAATGKRLWTIAPNRESDFFVPTPLIDQGRLVVVTESEGVQVFRFQAQGRIVPQPGAAFDLLKPQTHTPVISGQRLFGLTHELICLDSLSLALVYKAGDPAFGEHSNLFASPERVMICCDNGELIVINARSDKFDVLGRMRVFPDERGLLSHAALVGRTLYMRGSREIVGVDLDDKSADVH